MTVEAPERTPVRTDGPVDRGDVLRRARTVVTCVALVALAVSQDPGRVVPDTKLDLYTNPAGFLARALTLWEPLGFGGQVQNQAYGYLFPMGPFFVAGQLLGMPSWLVQRAWVAVLLCVAFLGVQTLARRLGIGTPWSRLAGGLLYALSPRMVSELGALSIEVLPMAVAPWVLVPLVDGARRGSPLSRRRGSPRRAAAVSALAVLCAGGVNAVAAFTVVVPAALFLLTREPGPRRRRLMAWWAGGVVLATFWWAAPLLLLGRYSPPFLDYIESASVTTAVSDPLSALRGTTQWIAYLGDARGPQWPAGASLVRDVLPVAGTVVIAALGVYALARRGLPERPWLVTCALAGLAALCVAYTGPVSGLLSDPARTALDGALAPLRNLHKFDLVLRLPLVLALVHLVGRAGRRWSRQTSRVLVAALVLGLVATSAPAWRGDLAASGGFTGLPGYWGDTAAFLERTRPSGRALVLPASSFGEYVWGTPRDEPMQPLARTPWDVRDAIPLTPEGHIRMLDAVGERLARGEGGPGLAGTLARSGVSHLVVRNDLDPAAEAVRPVLVAHALATSPGVRRVAEFGPLLFAGGSLPGLVFDGGVEPPVPAVTVYEVADPAPRAYTVPESGAVAVAGAPDALPALADRDLVSGRPVLFGPEAGTVAPLVQSDAPVRRERTFGRVQDAASAALAPDDPLRLRAAAPDYAVPDPDGSVGTVRYTGARPSASGSASDPDSFGGTRPGASPWAALDDDPASAWRPAVTPDRPAVWWRAALDAPLSADAVTITLSGTGVRATSPDVEVVTDAGTRRVPLRPTDEPQPLPLPPGPTRTLELRFDAGTRPPGIADVDVAGVRPERSVVLPAPSRPVSVYAFDVTGPARSGCVPDPDGAPRCSPALARAGEEGGVLDRTFTVAAPAAYDVGVDVVARPGPDLDALLDRALPASGTDDPVLRAVASSTAVPDPRTHAAAAVDGDPATLWRAAADDPDPRLDLSWDEPRTIDGLVLAAAPGVTAVPAAVRIQVGGQERLVNVGPLGVVRFAPLTTDRMTLRFPLAEPLASYDPVTRGAEPVGLGVREVTVPGLAPAVLPPETPVTLPCGAGPPIFVDGVRTDTSVSSTAGALRSGNRVRAVPCTDDGALRTPVLTPGEHRFTVPGTATFVAAAATLTDPAAPTISAGPTGPVSADAGRTAAVTPLWDAEHRTVEVGPRAEPRLLVVPENTNPGWTARLGDTPLQARTVDGWQQAYLLPPGPPGTVRLDFTPGGPYRAALAVGALAVVALLALAFVPGPAGPPAVRRRRRAGPVAGAAAVVAVLVAAGPVGAVALAVLLAVVAGCDARGLRPPRSGLFAPVAAAGVLAAGLTLPGGEALDPVRQVLVAVAVAALAASLLYVRRRGPGPGESG